MAKQKEFELSIVSDKTISLKVYLSMIYKLNCNAYYEKYIELTDLS